MNTHIEFLKQNWLNIALVGIIVWQMWFLKYGIKELPIQETTQAVLLLITKDDPEAQAIAARYGDTITRNEYPALMVKLNEHQRCKATPKN